jgi:Tol biopolymer transport system component
MLSELAAVSLGGYQQLATPAATNDGRLFFTYTSGAPCAPKGVHMECPKFVPDSCRNTVKTLSPGQSSPLPLFTVPGSHAITGEVVPDPDGGAVAMTLTPCTGTHGTTGLFVRDLNSGATHTIASSSNRCDGFGPAAWSPDGRQLVFPLDRARGKPIPISRRREQLIAA